MGVHIDSLSKRHFFCSWREKSNAFYFLHHLLFPLCLLPEYKNNFSFTNAELSLLIILSKYNILNVTIMKVSPKTLYLSLCPELSSSIFSHLNTILVYQHYNHEVILPLLSCPLLVMITLLQHWLLRSCFKINPGFNSRKLNISAVKYMWVFQKVIIVLKQIKFIYRT